MKNNIICLFILFLVFTFQNNSYAQAYRVLNVKTISAVKASAYITAGKGILIHSGGEAHIRRHIQNSIEIHASEVQEGRKPLPALPRKGIAIFTYCY